LSYIARRQTGIHGRRWNVARWHEEALGTVFSRRQETSILHGSVGVIIIIIIIIIIKIYRTIVLPVVLYGCGTWSLTVREERRLRVFENRVLRRIFGPKRDEVTGKCRKLHNEELNDLNSTPSIVRVIKSRRMRWAGHVARMGREEVYTGFWW